MSSPRQYGSPRSHRVSDTEPPPRRKWRPVVITGCAAVVVAAVVTAVLLPDGAPDDARGTAAGGVPHTSVQVSQSGCGSGWRRPHTGTQVFDLHNVAGVATEVYLTDARSGAVLGEVEGLGPGTTRPLRVRLGAGSYAFKCLPDDADAVTGETVRVSGGGSPGPAALPVSQHDLIPATLDYQKWVGRRMDELADRVGTLRAAVDRGDLAGARRDWLTAHLVYERMGAAYGAFGDADGAINGTTAGLADGVHDKDFTGFHRIEYGLWHEDSTTGVRRTTAQLVKDVEALRESWAQERMDPLDMGLRAHEILENTVQFELTGRTDYGSHTNLATARANLDGTRAVLDHLHPMLTARIPGQLKKIDSWLDRTRHTLDGFAHDGHWEGLAELNRADRQRVDADVNEAVERLAPVAAVFDVRRTS
ncbi:EfeM/EfeO family lipoprotein [Streptomyces sp. NPDC059740]|uniref:EfeM/EfeO family lipoprotein n=1 Tax=Streptomyces sp. NPDC059740 TaxID=3346926 RepID=UPI003656D9F3